MPDIYSQLETLIKYPSVIGLRVIVNADTIDPLIKIKEVINGIKENSMKEVTEAPRRSTKGNYVSYTVPVEVTDKSQVKALYEKLSALDFVKHVI